jgi:hypothetical protein
MTHIEVPRHNPTDGFAMPWPILELRISHTNLGDVFFILRISTLEGHVSGTPINQETTPGQQQDAANGELKVARKSHAVPANFERAATGTFVGTALLTESESRVLFMGNKTRP